MCSLLTVFSIDCVLFFNKLFSLSLSLEHHETPFSNLITDIRPIVLPAEREWPDQLDFLDQMRDRA